MKTAAEIAQERSAKLKGPRQLESGGTTVTGTLTQFRPPPGYLDATLKGEELPEQMDASDTGAMLSKLKAEAGETRNAHNALVASRLHASKPCGWK